MSRSNPFLLIAAVCVLPLGAAAGVKLTLTPTAAPVRIREMGNFTAVVTGTSQKTVKFKVCDGAGLNCVNGGNVTLGTLVQIGTDASNNPIARYTAPAVLPPTLSCQSVVLGCQVKLQAIIKVGLKKKKSFSTVVLAAPGVIRRVSVAVDGSEANAGSAHNQPSVGADGRFIAFGSQSTNLVGDDANLANDIFVRDTCTGAPAGCVPTTLRVSLADDRSEANGGSAQPAMTPDGRFVAFQSSATNLTAEATGGLAHIYVRDTCLGAGSGCTTSTKMVSLATDGTVGNLDNRFPAIGTDGRTVAFLSEASNLVGSDTNGAFDAFVRDTCAGVPTGCSPSTTRVSLADDGSEGNGVSNRVGLSADGRLVVFASAASNLVSSDINGVADVFVRDTCFGASGPCTPSTTRVSVASDGTEGDFGSGVGFSGQAISADGRFVTFHSFAGNLVAGDFNSETDIFVRDTCQGTPGCTPSTVRVSVAT